jgi:branched-chain amino acid transport system permease protein
MWAVFPTHFEHHHSIWFLGMIIVGGMGYTTGAEMGTVFVRILGEVSSILSEVVAKLLPAIAGQISAALTPIVFGLVVLLFIVFEPRGLAHRWESFEAAYRIWPFSY